MGFSKNDRIAPEGASYGVIDEHFPEGYSFHWMRHNAEGEIWGSVQRADGSLVSGASGWYRTEIPGYAADRARYLASQDASGTATPQPTRGVRAHG